MKNQTFEITIPADLALSPLVRDAASLLFFHAKFPMAWCNRLKLVTDELFMNAVQYGSTLGTSQVSVRFTFSDDEAECEVSDDGTGPEKITPEALQERIMKNGQEANLTKTSGRGLAMITRLWTDRFSVKANERGGISVVFAKKITTVIPPEAPAEPSASPEGAPAAVSSLPPNTLQWQEGASAVTVRLKGPLDRELIEAIGRAITEKIQAMPSGAALTLDCQDIDYINSTFIGFLASFYNDLSKKQSSLQLSHVQESVRDVIELVGLNKVIQVN